MFRKLFISISVAVQNVRNHLFHTLLSILGVVIGVAALIAILCLINGLEQYARNQITKTTSLKSIVVRAKTRTKVNGVWVDKEKPPAIYPDDLRSLSQQIPEASLQLKLTSTAIIHQPDSQKGIGVYFSAIYSDSLLYNKYDIWKGDLSFDSSIFNTGNSAVISYSLAHRLSQKMDGNLIGSRIELKGVSYKIAAILNKNKAKGNWVFAPLRPLLDAGSSIKPPLLIAEAPKIEKVPAYKKKIKKWLAANFKNAENSFKVVTHQFRLKQANNGMFLFKLIMGLITGISVIVGGVGIMNVLLISVKERTKEIGIRKATGARKRDIIFQFLSESVTISALGSLLGLIVGFLGSVGLAFIISQFTGMAFHATFTWTTLVVIAVVALLIGIIFGTYPALKAARLTPVDAIRYE